MPRRLTLVDAVLGVWAVAWLVTGVLVFQTISRLEEGGRAAVTAAEGLDETSAALDRASGGLHETGRALDVLSDLPFLSQDPGAAVTRTAEDVARLAERVRVTAVDARTTGRDAERAARTLALVLGVAIALAPTLPVLLLYVLLRPLVAGRLRTR